MSIGKIERVPLRQVWRHEALDFTTWLEQNIDALSEVLDLSLSSAEREQSAGDFSVDIVAEDGSGNTVIIENQLEQSDHDHLGKLVTYVSMLEAKAAIWIVAAPRPEHVRAVAWLNDRVQRLRAAGLAEIPIEIGGLSSFISAPYLDARGADAKAARGVHVQLLPHHQGPGAHQTRQLG